MSFTEIKIPPLNEVIATEDGIKEAHISIKSLSVITQVDGLKLLKIEKTGENPMRFFLNQEQCVHLSNLLINPNVKLTGRGTES
ncbi:hypothetical protein [Methyloglobulus sp.]|uniref:hypothetical protein n=1 Tax=Methyloglobulus sp. TaxID=2518622 RepID=UPI0032B8146C